MGLAIFGEKHDIGGNSPGTISAALHSKWSAVLLPEYVHQYQWAMGLVALHICGCTMTLLLVLTALLLQDIARYIRGMSGYSVTSPRR